ncbi:MAG: aspartate carbamoyltransferase catalytic subunit [bacterium]|nr:aspartate carbamoyltransferase catalytic subunit [bacterium]MCS7310691.1 aspartate carbamoyltransferase catalytic subunit [Armatimonadota bacterium]MDW8105488.1 aspartate carbamoyltransferase catalytic subunit [Armatimonadota bacterium]
MLTDLITLRETEPEDIRLLLDTAQSFKEILERPVKKVPTLRGKQVVTLFYEASTRTRVSFESAAKIMSADTTSVAAATSSVQKGESLLDTVRNLRAMRIDCLVMRHPQSGAAALAAQALDIPVVNAGDGMHEHPTQALLDMLTMRQHKGRLEGLTVAIVGDIAHSRVARSNLWGLTKMGAKVRFVGPATLLPRDVERLPVEVYTDLRQGLEGADVVMALRLQQERMERGLLPSLREYARCWGVNAKALEVTKPDCIVMHPGPMNRGVEIADDVADSGRSVILEQVTNGVAIRMAVLYHLLGGEAAA